MFYPSLTDSNPKVVEIVPGMFAVEDAYSGQCDYFKTIDGFCGAPLGSFRKLLEEQRIQWETEEKRRCEAIRRWQDGLRRMANDKP